MNKKRIDKIIYLLMACNIAVPVWKFLFPVYLTGSSFYFHLWVLHYLKALAVYLTVSPGVLVRFPPIGILWLFQPSVVLMIFLGRGMLRRKNKARRIFLGYCAINVSLFIVSCLWRFIGSVMENGLALFSLSGFFYFINGVLLVFLAHLFYIFVFTRPSVKAQFAGEVPGEVPEKFPGHNT